MAETRQKSISDLVNQAREKLDHELRGQADQLERLDQSLQELRAKHQQLAEAIQQQLEVLGRFQPPPAAAAPPGDAALSKVLAAVRNLITATLPEQVQAVLTEEADQLGVRAAVFDVRGKAAWGAAARGFAPELSPKAFRAIVVPLTQESPFRQCFETGGHVDATVDSLKRNRNILEKFRPDPADPILLLPIRSAGSVSAIFYADAGGQHQELPVDALKILAEFAGAQLDRLMAFGGGMPAEAVEEEVEAIAAVPEAVSEAPVEVVEPVPAEEPVAAGIGGVAVAEAPSISAVETTPLVEEIVPPVARPVQIEQPPIEVAPIPPVPAVPAGFDLAQLSEADQRVHRDAKRFAKLLVSEIELYNKSKVADGRRNADLYRRLKSDIDRSRQTYEKRFGKTVAERFDHFHEELVRTLASSDPSLLGADYPGPAV